MQMVNAGLLTIATLQANSPAQMRRRIAASSGT